MEAAGLLAGAIVVSRLFPIRVYDPTLMAAAAWLGNYRVFLRGLGWPPKSNVLLDTVNEPRVTGNWRSLGQVTTGADGTFAFTTGPIAINLPADERRMYASYTLFAAYEPKRKLGRNAQLPLGPWPDFRLQE